VAGWDDVRFIRGERKIWRRGKVLATFEEVARIQIRRQRSDSGDYEYWLSLPFKKGGKFILSRYREKESALTVSKEIAEITGIQFLLVD
jgi:hypothetical protein